MEQKIRQKVFGFMIIAFKLGQADSHNPEQDTCHWQSIWYETLLLFNISLREIFSKSVSLRVMEKYDESTLTQISQVFVTLQNTLSQSTC